MAQFATTQRGIFRAVAIALLMLSAGFTFPESHYSTEKTYVKAPSPQTEICSLLCDDVEDSNDYATGVHFFQSAVAVEWTFSSLPFSCINSAPKEIHLSIDERAYLLHRQLLI